MLLKMIVIGGAMLALFSVAMLGDENMQDSRFGVQLTADRAVYTAGQPITMEFCVFNRTGEEITLHFSDAQRFDFTIQEEVETDQLIEFLGAKEVWHWSDGQMFAQMLGEEKIWPEREEITTPKNMRENSIPGHTESPAL